MDHSPPHPRDNGPAPEEIPLLTRIIATGFFSGYIPWASGTFGSMVGIALYLIPGAGSPPVLAAMIAAGFVIGAVTAGRVARIVGHRLSATAQAAKDAFQGGEAHHPDPSIVVIDEIVGMWISLILLPNSAVTIILAFLFFRAYDILKPPPARQLEQVPDGWGIMLDDVAAGVYANLSVRLVELVFGTGV
jgi:phosphatidylglycerophosphatase A